MCPDTSRSDRLVPAMQQGIADHRADQCGRDAKGLGDLVLLHAVDAAHLEGVELALNATNLLDEKYVTGCYSTMGCQYGSVTYNG